MGADAGLVSWSSLSGAPPDGVRTSLGSEVTSAASSQWRTSRPPRKAQLTGCAECWTRRRRYGAGGGAEWRCQLASLRQATRLAGECPDPQQVGRESLVGEEWEPPELLDGDGGDGDGEGKPSRRRQDARAGVGISPRPGARCSACARPRPGAGRVGGELGWKRRRADAATERRRHEADCPLPGRAWREPRAKGAGPIRRLGETRRTS